MLVIVTWRVIWRLMIDAAVGQRLLSLLTVVLCGRRQFMIFALWLSVMENENTMIISQKAAVIMVSRAMGLCDIECCTHRVIVVAFTSDGCVQC